MAFYVICDDDSKHESMTKEQILSAIAQALTGEVVDPNAGFITKVKETNAGAYITFWVGTRAEYNALTTIEKNCLYIFTDDTSAEDLDATVKKLHADFDALSAEVGKKAPTGLTDVKNLKVGSWDELNALIDKTAHGMDAGTVKILSITMWLVEPYSGAQVTIYKGKNDTFYETVDVEMLTSGRLYRRHGEQLTDDEYVWSEWEHDNPQKLNSTYCTTERYQGEPVYVKLESLDALPSSGSRSVAIGVESAEIVSVKVIATKKDGSVAQQLPFISDIGQVLAFAKVTDPADYGTCDIFVTDDMSDYSATIEFKYIKK